MAQRSGVCGYCGRLFVREHRKSGPPKYCGQPCAKKAIGAARVRAVDERFDAYVRPEGECLVWTGAASPKGYGRFRGDSGKTVSAHRFAWGRAGRVVPQGMVLMHKCDNPRCVNLAHLAVGTPAMNSADMVAKQRSASGEQHSQAVLTVDRVAGLKAAVRNGESVASAARRMGIKKGTAYSITQGRNWKDRP